MLHEAYPLLFLVAIRMVRIGSGVKLIFQYDPRQFGQAIYGINTLVISCGRGTAGPFFLVPKFADSNREPLTVFRTFRLHKDSWP